MLICISYVFCFTSISFKTTNENKISLSYYDHIHYGEYFDISKEAYTYNIIQWSFSTNNQSEINLLVMDYLNYQKFYINDSTTYFQVLSEGLKKDNGIFNVPYDDTWVFLFFNGDPTYPYTDIELEVKLILNPFFYIFLPISLILVVILSFILISIYYKRLNKENKVSNYFIVFIMFLFIYFSLYWLIIPNIFNLLWYL